MALIDTFFDAPDPEKEAANLLKHGVSFDEAMSVFRDPLSLTGPDSDHSHGELRFLVTGRSRFGNTLIVSHTEREGRIRIISARRATRTEIRHYEDI